MIPLEKTFQARVNRQLSSLLNTWFFKASDRVKSGIPDILLCIDGQFVALELKRSLAAKATPLQLYTLDKIKDAQGTAMVVCPETWRKTFQMLVTMAGGVKEKKRWS